MDPLAVLCLYSQYSTHSDRFLKKIKKYNIDFMELIPVDTLYSRNIVSSKIKTVPAVIIQYPDSLEIYEGDEATDWLDDVIQNKQKDDLQKELLKKLEEEKYTNIPSSESSQLETKGSELSPPPVTNTTPLSMTPPPMTNSAPTPPESSNEKDNKYTPIDDVVTIDDNRGVETQTQQKLSASSKKTQDLLARARELEKGREDLGGKKPPFLS